MRKKKKFAIYLLYIFIYNKNYFEIFKYLFKFFVPHWIWSILKLSLSLSRIERREVWIGASRTDFHISLQFWHCGNRSYGPVVWIGSLNLFERLQCCSNTHMYMYKYPFPSIFRLKYEVFISLLLFIFFLRLKSSIHR